VQHKPKKAFQIKKAAPKLTVPAAPVSHLARRLGEKAPAVAAEPKANGTAAAGATAADFVNRKPTQPEPFTFATDARLKAPHPAAAAEAAPTVAEAAERFMRDPRSHGAPPHVPGRRTEAHPPKLCTDLRAKTDYRPKVRDGDDDEAQSFVPSSSHLSHPTRTRTQPLSTEEKEAQEFAALQSKAFKAKPVDRRIFESMGELGVPKVPPNPSPPSDRPYCRNHSHPHPHPLTQPPCCPAGAGARHHGARALRPPHRQARLRAAPRADGRRRRGGGAHTLQGAARAGDDQASSRVVGIVQARRQSGG
jgi:hypothetical protein